MINKIVVTGGPCAGKSTALLKIREEFEKLGYKVITINETATELISSGITTPDCSVFTFQQNLLNLQLQKESSIYNCAKEIEKKHDKILIVCDRGAMDGMSYMTVEEFEKILKSLKLNLVELRDRYDAVFHLITTADGAEEHYTTENNSARTETVKEALECDRRLIGAWCGHPHLRVIDNSTDYNGKAERLITEIKAFLGEPKPLEIEHKYLIKYPNTEYLKGLPNCRRVEIEQIYCNDGHKNFRLRKRGEDGNYIYFRTEKIQLSAAVRIENEKRITEEEYNNAVGIKGKIVKERYCLMYDNNYFEIDVYPFWHDKAVMEIELCDENRQYKLPDFIEVIEDVTGNTDYNNSHLAMMNNG